MWFVVCLLRKEILNLYNMQNTKNITLSKYNLKVADIETKRNNPNTHIHDCCVVCGMSVEKKKSLNLNNTKNKKHHTVGTKSTMVIENFLDTEAKSITQTYKYMTTHFPDLVHVRHLNKNLNF